MGLKETIVDYDQFFNGKRDQKEMKLALREAHHNLNRFRQTRRSQGAAGDFSPVVSQASLRIGNMS